MALGTGPTRETVQVPRPGDAEVGGDLIPSAKIDKGQPTKEPRRTDQRSRRHYDDIRVRRPGAVDGDGLLGRVPGHDKVNLGAIGQALDAEERAPGAVELSSRRPQIQNSRHEGQVKLMHGQLPHGGLLRIGTHRHAQLRTRGQTKTSGAADLKRLTLVVLGDPEAQHTGAIFKSVDTINESVVRLVDRQHLGQRSQHAPQLPARHRKEGDVLALNKKGVAYNM